MTRNNQTFDWGLSRPGFEHPAEPSAPPTVPVRRSFLLVFVYSVCLNQVQNINCGVTCTLMCTCTGNFNYSLSNKAYDLSYKPILRSRFHTCVYLFSLVLLMMCIMWWKIKIHSFYKTFLMTKGGWGCALTIR